MIELANGMSLPEGAVVQSIVCHMDNAREYSAIVERIQYDKTLPVIEVYLSSGGVPYEVPENARFLSASVKETVKAYIIRHLD